VNESIRETHVLAWQAAISALAGAAAFALATPKFAASVLLGAALQTLNFRGLFGLARSAFASESRAASGFALRLPLFGVLVFAAISAGVDAAGLLLGVTTLVPAVVISAWHARPRPLPTSELPALAPDDPSWDLYSPWLARERELESKEDES
jgi:hypothetical protein